MSPPDNLGNLHVLLMIFWQLSLASVPAIPALKQGKQTSAYFSKCECH